MALSKFHEKILSSIKVASENDPKKPEFPPNDPKFPATPTYKIEVPGFSNVWLKDESFNPTGTHKDRMAWEMVVIYRDFLIAKKRGQVSEDLPRLSLISSGSAAIAIQTMLRKYNLPNLNVLVDENMRKELVSYLERLGCDVYKCDLRKKSLDWKEVLELTHNERGFDITSADAFGPTTNYYDWLSYEVLNSSPEYCFIPFGTGNLYQNILNVNKREVSSKFHDPRFFGNPEVLKNCSFFGSTTNNPSSKAEKLYAPHNPFSFYNEQWIHIFRSAGYCNEASGVYTIEEDFLNEAILLGQELRINAEPSGIAGLALLLQMRHSIPSDKKILIINTGKTKLPQ
ncbi:MAG: PLP-dependent lyase/thiolase [Candidatus Diapherotrites archaeon]|nr:PLP-dependent lyase/thiolase [Candidatus Diapherotrites archaeon]